MRIKKVLLYLDIEEDNIEKVLDKKFDGEDLSGGQWQKLAISRVLYLNKKIFLLDEPTAALDPKIENKIYQDFLKITKDKTVIFIAHRLATVKKADKVLLIKNGKLLAFDKHETLIKGNLYYNELYNL